MWVKLKDIIVEYRNLVVRIFAPIMIKTPAKILFNYIEYLKELRKYRKLPGSEKIKLVNLYPCIYEKNKTTPLDTYYFYQDIWLAEKIIDVNPEFHVDIGSSAILVGFLSKITKVFSVDIRPLPVETPNLEVRYGSILKIPFENNKLNSLSSLCVLEHVGLGRYGDPLDPEGTDKAISELGRVLAPGGDIYISVPIEDNDNLYFNAHRAFGLSAFMKKWQGFDLMEVKFISNGKLYSMEEYENINKKYFIVGLFHFKKSGI